MTEWEEIRKLRPKDYLQHMKTPAIVDARKLYKPKDFRELNFVSIGLGPRNYAPENAQNKPDSPI